MDLLIEADGSIRCIYSEAFDLSSLGSLAIRRGSLVEPDSDGHWHADLSPVGGPTLGPFPQRSQALEAEIDWLTLNWLSAPAG